MLASFVAVLIAWAVSGIFSQDPVQAGVAIGSSWYSVNLTELGASRELWGLDKTSGDSLHKVADQLAASFVLSSQDEGLSHFLSKSAEGADTTLGRIKRRLAHYLFWGVQRYLGWSRPDASGLLGKELYVASEPQFHALVKHAKGLGNSASTGTLLDIGAGRGTETEKMAAALGIEPHNVQCLESSGSMRSALSARGFQVASSVDELRNQPFAAVSLLNVLDRSVYQ